jgi:predicted small lipoprotein YifL
MTTRRTFATLCVALSIALLAGCGRPGRPLAPPGSTYPLVYPNPADIPGGVPQAPVAAPQAQSPSGNRIDPSVRAMTLSPPPVPGANLPNTTTIQGNDPMERSIGPQGPSPLALPPAFPAEGQVPE